MKGVDALNLKEFQRLMKQLYFKRDYERGVLKTALWLTEEIGELAKAIVRDGNYEEELVDVVAWTASRPNVLNVDLVTALNKKYSPIKKITREFINFVKNILIKCFTIKRST